MILSQYILILPEAAGARIQFVASVDEIKTVSAYCNFTFLLTI